MVKVIILNCNLYFYVLVCYCMYIALKNQNERRDVKNEYEQKRKAI